jgi:hypothetical protein
VQNPHDPPVFVDGVYDEHPTAAEEEGAAHLIQDMRMLPRGFRGRSLAGIVL